MAEDFYRNPHSIFDIRGRSAIITGASGAFGAVAAKVLAGAGANVTLVAGSKDALAETARACRELGADVEEVNSRPDSEQACDSIVQAAVRRFGRVDILVVASGKNDVAKIVEMTPARFLDVMDANVTQSWLMARAAGKQMLAQGRGGKVILMSSARGILGHPAGYTAYCASKSAIDGITRALGCEWGETGITVNAHRSHGLPLAVDGMDVRRHGARERSPQGIFGARAEGSSGRAVGPRRTAVVPRLGRIRFLHRAHPVRGRRLHGRLTGPPQRLHATNL